MEKRLLIGIFCIALVYFLINSIFNTSDNTALQKTGINAPQTEVVLAKQPSQPILINPSEYQEHQIVTLYKDVELKQPAALAIELDINYLTFAWDEDVPEELFVKKVIDGIPSIRRIELRIPPDKKDDPIFYSLFPLSKLNIPWVPVEGKLDALLVYFDSLRAYKIPAQTSGTDQLFIKAKPSLNAFAILLPKNELGPYGYFDVRTGQLLYFDHIPSFESFALLTYPNEPEFAADFQKQELYVLENDYQQLVFTNINGSLKEINLPFPSDTNQKSVVRPIGFDRIMQKSYNQNDTFPQSQAYAPGEKGGKPVLMNPKVGGYTPLIRRNIIGAQGATSVRIDPHYYALNIFQIGHTQDTRLYQLKRFEKNLIEFELVEPNRKITKTFTLPENPDDSPYVLNLDVKVEGDARDLALTVGIPEVELISGSFTPHSQVSDCPRQSEESKGN